MTRFVLAFVLALFALSTVAHAHTRSQSLSHWSIDGDALDVRVEASAVDVTRLYALGGDASLPATFAEEVARGLSVKVNGQECAPIDEPAVVVTQSARLVARWRFECAEGSLADRGVQIESGLFLDVAPSHLHFVALHDGEGGVAEAVLTEPHPRAELNPSAAPETRSFWQTVSHFAPIGAEHVWTGLDHVAFILALVLLTMGHLRGVILAATGFTLGHSVTLGLAAMNVLRPDGNTIEALIGFTIAFVALEAGERGGARMREWSAPAAAFLVLAGVLAMAGAAPMSPLVWFGLAMFVYAYPRGFPRGAVWIALIFGLIHGCGFAGALAELELPRPRLIASLLGFNLGVEFGQIVVIAMALLVGLAAKRAPDPWRMQGATVAGAALFALGFFWFASRLIA